MKQVKIANYIKIILAFTFMNLLILAIRNIIVGDSVFNFLKSNLLSGVIPFIIALLLQTYNSKLSNIGFILISLLWLLFYPNSPYMISDLIHPTMEKQDIRFPELIIFDTLIIFSIAMLSVFCGFISLKIMFNLFVTRYGKNIAHSALVFALVLSCLGFYMGRELLSVIKLGNGYLYSWEIFLEPVQIFKTVWHSLFPIQDHWSAYAMMALFGFIQYMLLVMFKDVSDIENAEIVTKA